MTSFKATHLNDCLTVHEFQISLTSTLPDSIIQIILNRTFGLFYGMSKQLKKKTVEREDNPIKLI